MRKFLSNRLKNLKFGLLPRVLLAIVLGLLLGRIMPVWLSRIFITFNAIFSQFLSFLIPLIILALVTVAIAGIGNKAGKVLGVTVLISYLLTVGAGFFSYGICGSVFPSFIQHSPLKNGEVFAELQPFFAFKITPLMDVTMALVLAFMLGIGLTKIKSKALSGVADDFCEIVTLVIKKAIIPLLPIYIFGIFVNMVATGSARSTIQLFLVVIAIITVLLMLWLLIIFCVAAFVVKRNPFKLFAQMLPAFFTALGTSSSAATIPVTLEQVKKLGVSTQIAEFVVPLCATIHLSGSELKVVGITLALLLMQGVTPDFALFLPFILLMAVITMAAPGIPGGVVMAVLPLTQSLLGFGDAECAILISVYIAIDSFGTAANVTGDGAIALVIDKWFGGKMAENNTKKLINR